MMHFKSSLDLPFMFKLLSSEARIHWATVTVAQQNNRQEKLSIQKSVRVILFKSHGVKCIYSYALECKAMAH